jgi:hypothetical protein
MKIYSMKQFIFILGLVVISTVASAQIQGVVFGLTGGKKIALKQARVSLVLGKTNVLTDENGRFELVLSRTIPDTLVVTSKGFLTEKLIVNKQDRFIGLEIVLLREDELEEVIIAYKRDSKSISRLKPIMVESLGEAELKKAACCNLSESFETNATVDVNLTDAISGAKKIQMLGLDGVYTQFQMENIPFLTGLESSFGMNTIPGSWVESIQLTKATGSVVNGYESMAGLINVEFRKPRTTQRFFVNGYGNSNGRMELNLHGGQLLSNRWSTASFIHVSGLTQEIDRNKDHFRDTPLSKTMSFLNRWEYNGKRFEARFGVNGYWDERQGGQLSNIPNRYIGATTNQHIDVFAKTGFLFPDKPRQSLGIVSQVKMHDLSGQFGKRIYGGQEKRAYVNVIYDGSFGSAIHSYKSGVSIVAQDLAQQLDSVSYIRKVATPGAFFEYTYQGVRLVAVVGARYDIQHQFGNQFSPRLHLKYILDEHTDVRISSGKAFRLANPIIDYSSYMATAKSWHLPTKIEQEVVWNTGTSVVRTLKMWHRNASIAIDYYHAYFINQLVVDRERSMDTFYFEFQNRSSFNNALQVEWSASPIQTLTVRVAYKWLQSKAMYNGSMRQQIMMPNHRVLLNIAYASRNHKWEIDATLSIYSKVRLHDIQLPDGTMAINQYGNAYPSIIGQVTHHFKYFDWYVGGENLANYTQKNPIISASNPADASFDATRIYAPVLGTVIYTGFRYEIKRKKEKR